MTRLVLDWDDGLARSIAAENLFLDRSLDRRRADVAALRAKVGPAGAGSAVRLGRERAARKWILPCERGDLLVSVTLAPTMPPLVQYLDVAPPSTVLEMNPKLTCLGS